MAAVTIRNLSDEALRSLEARAARHNRSAEAEMRAILEAAAHAPARARLGSVLQEIGRKHDITHADVQAAGKSRDARAADPVTLD